MMPQFPPGKSGGLIEARISAAPSLKIAAMFPPGKSGGLIEARRRRWRTIASNGVTVSAG